ncbi:hypothetical protein EH31_09600 [Erythrobacter longus]|uniref:Uncharacterized protein n=1 Tax=Erythrobacter longus TaxID=1044 RepID=A0A074MA84_ERYLO|nr:hypothetical protein EH31_09600 [Erythrobacter longus]
MRIGTALILSAQGLLTAASLTLAAFYPPEGSAAVLFDLNHSSPNRALAWSARHDLPLISFAQNGASPIVQLDGQISAFDAVKAGFLPVSAQPDLCRPNPNVEKIVS